MQNKQRIIQRGPRRQKGLSLLELMVALTLGLFVAAATLQVFIGSRNSLNVVQANSSMQGGARFGFHFVKDGTRQAGYLNTGAMDEGGNLFATELVNKFNAAVEDPNAGFDANPYVENPWLAAGPFNLSAVVASDGADVAARSGTTVKANTDVLQLRLQGEDDGSMLDCEGQAITSATSIVSFFVGDDDQLYCQVDARPEVALVSGIENMQVLFGVATAGSGPNKYIVDQYTNAPANWSQVMTVKVALLATSDNEGLDSSSKTYNILDVQDTFSDGKARQVFTQTIALRGNLSN